MVAIWYSYQLVSLVNQVMDALNVFVKRYLFTCMAEFVHFLNCKF